MCPWRPSLQKEGWRQQMDEIRAVRTIEQLLFARSQMAAPFLGPGCQGVAYTVSPPLRAVSRRDSGTFVCFSGSGLDKASSKFHSIYLYNYT